MSERLVVYIIDDDKSVVDSQKALIESMGYEARVYHLVDDFLADYDPSLIGCILLDVRIPQMSGTQLQDIFIRENKRTPIVFMSGHADVQVAVAAMKKGAVDFLAKPINNEKLLETINKAIKRDKARFKFEAESKAVQSKLDKLTAKELNILEGLIEGNTSRVISQDLNIKFNTVEQYRAGLLRKLQSKNVVSLVNKVLNHRFKQQLQRSSPDALELSDLYP